MTSESTPTPSGGPDGRAYLDGCADIGRASDLRDSGGRTSCIAPRTVSRTAGRLSPTLRVLLPAAGVAALLGTFVHANGFVWLAAIVSTVALGTLWPRIACRGVTATLAVPATRGQERTPATLTLRLHNRLPWSTHGLILRTSFVRPSGPSAGEYDVPTPLPTLGARSIMDVPVRFTPPFAGVYDCHAWQIETAFPFGLTRASRAVTPAAAAEWVVWPTTYRVGPVPDDPYGRQASGLSARPDVSGDRVGVRPWRRGDALRQVHWSQTARHGHLIVSEYEHDAGPTVLLSLGSAGPSDDTSLDLDPEIRRWLLRIVASLAKGWIAAGTPLTLLLGSSRGTRRVDASPRTTPAALLDALVRWDGTPAAIPTDTAHAERYAAIRVTADPVDAAAWPGASILLAFGRDRIVDGPAADPVPREVTRGRRSGLAPIVLTTPREAVDLLTRLGRTPHARVASRRETHVVLN